MSAKRSVIMITGASSGIGRAFALQLARLGFDLIVVARRRDRLEALAQELHGVANVQIEVADLANSEDRTRLVKCIEQTPSFSHLIHNAGFGVTGNVGEASVARLHDMASVHVLATLELCSAAAARLRERKSGGILVVSSIAGWLTGSGSAMYCATKSFQTSFTRSLARELAPCGVAVTALCPGYTRSEFHDTLEYAHWKRSSVPNALWSTADEVARAGWLALQQRQDVCIPGFRNRMLVRLVGLGFLSPLREWVRRRRNAQRTASVSSTVE